MLSREDLVEYNVSLLDIYMKFLLIQIRTEIDVSEITASSEGHQEENELDAEEKEKLGIITKGLTNAKYCFLLKLQTQTYLISKVNVQGVIVYKDSKENRVIIGSNFPAITFLVDDGTEVTRAILWQKDYSEQFSSDKYFVYYTKHNHDSKLELALISLESLNTLTGKLK